MNKKKRQGLHLVLLNFLLWLLILAVKGLQWGSLTLCLLASALLVEAVLDLKSFQIPNAVNFSIFLLGIIETAGDYENRLEHIEGFFLVSGILMIPYLISKGKTIGGGDIKLTAVAGLFLGWQRILLAFLLAGAALAVFCIARWHHLGSREPKDAKRLAAFGPFLSIGIYLSALWGDWIIAWYLRVF